MLASFNLVNFLFINLTITIVILGGLVTTVEKYMPALIAQTFRYGKHAYKGKTDKLVTMLEVPKYWFKHFYVFAALWSVAASYFTISLYLFGRTAPDYLVKFLDLTTSATRQSQTSSFTTLVAISLITLQCLRRFYETHFVQVFSKTLKIHLSQYFVGYIHYFGTVVIVLSQAEGFVNGEPKNVPLRVEFSVNLMLWTSVFLYAWYHQFRSNLILANMRKDKTGAVVTQKHMLPKGGYFEKVSSPHMLFEILMYVSLYGILYENTSWILVVVWVVSNQISNAWLTHQWYKENFKDYPGTRKAVFPNLL